MKSLTQELQEYCSKVSEVEIYCYDYNLNEKHFDSLNDYLNSDEFKKNFTNNITFIEGSK